MFPTYPPLIPMIPPCTYSPQPSVQIYLGYGHCTPIVVSPISASVGAPMVLKVVDAERKEYYFSSSCEGYCLLQIRVKWLVVMMRGKVAANEWWVRGECYGFELHFPLGT